MVFKERSANRKTPKETAAMAADALTFADELIWCDDTPDGK